MPTPTITQGLNDRVYFLTFTVKNWYYLFDRYDRWEILADSLSYCQKYKALKVYHYVFMLNHIHLLVESPDVAGFVRDFKRFTARELHKNLAANEPTVLKLFEGGDGEYGFWKNGNMPVLIESPAVYFEKAQYIEENPIKKRYVSDPGHWIYSSANLDSLVKVDRLDV